jgi:hypothetical protein
MPLEHQDSIVSASLSAGARGFQFSVFSFQFDRTDSANGGDTLLHQWRQPLAIQNLCVLAPLREAVPTLPLRL